MFALLPMKEHSDRVPEKNFRLLHGKPLFFYIADTLQEVGLFDNLVINTDSKIIEKLAKDRYGQWVIIIPRPNELNGDHISMNAILNYDVNRLGLRYDFMQTHSTNPFLKPSTIIAAHNCYLTGKKSEQYDSLFSVNVMKTRLYHKDLSPINHTISILQRTQDLAEIYEENSSFYFFSGNSFKKRDHRIGIQPQVFKMSRSSIESLDIDDMSDWNFSELILQAGLT